MKEKERKQKKTRKGKKKKSDNFTEAKSRGRVSVARGNARLAPARFAPRQSGAFTDPGHHALFEAQRITEMMKQTQKDEERKTRMALDNQKAYFQSLYNNRMEIQPQKEVAAEVQRKKKEEQEQEDVREERDRRKRERFIRLNEEEERRDREAAELEEERKREWDRDLTLQVEHEKRVAEAQANERAKSQMDVDPLPEYVTNFTVPGRANLSTVLGEPEGLKAGSGQQLGEFSDYLPRHNNPQVGSGRMSHTQYARRYQLPEEFNVKRTLIPSEEDREDYERDGGLQHSLHPYVSRHGSSNIHSARYVDIPASGDTDFGVLNSVPPDIGRDEIRMHEEMLATDLANRNAGVSDYFPPRPLLDLLQPAERSPLGEFIEPIEPAVPTEDAMTYTSKLFPGALRPIRKKG